MLLCDGAALPVLFANRGWSANLLTLPSDLLPKQTVAAVVGTGATDCSIGGVSCAVASGWIPEVPHRYEIMPAVAGESYLLALLCAVLIAPGHRAPDLVTQTQN